MPITLTVPHKLATIRWVLAYGLFAVPLLILCHVLQGWVLAIPADPANGPAVHFLDVGEGSAAWLEDGDGNNILIDTGNPISGNRICRILRHAGVNRIDTLIITHPHPDHMGGIFCMMPRLRTDHLYDNGQPIPGRPDCDLYRWYVQLFRSSEKYRVLQRGSRLEWNGMSIEVLWPIAGNYSRNWNENSLVLRISTRGKYALLMGDATSKVEVRLLEMDPEALKADLLVIGHHGAGDATSLAFLKAVDPKWAIIPVNKDNIRGYPSSKVLKRLRDNGTVVYVLYKQGDCTWDFSDKGPCCVRK